MKNEVHNSLKVIFEKKRNNTMIIKAEKLHKIKTSPLYSYENSKENSETVLSVKHGVRKNSIELNKLINEGDMPIFGYPVLCYSPINEDQKTKQDNFWQKIFKDTLTYKKNGR